MQRKIISGSKLHNIIFFVVIFLVFIFIVSFSSKPLILLFAKKNLNKIFPGDTVLIRDCKLDSLHSISFFDIEIESLKKYNFKIKEAKIVYSLPSLIKKKFLKIYLKGALINIKSFDDFIKFSKYLEAKQPNNRFSVDILKLSDFNINIKTKNLILKTSFSLEFYFPKKLINLLEINLENLKVNDFLLYKGYVKVDKHKPYGDFLVKQLAYKGVKIKDIQSNLIIKNKDILFDNLVFNIIGGKAGGSLFVDFDKEIKYILKLNFFSLEAEKFVEDFKFKKNLFATGKWNGNFYIETEGLDIKNFSGNFKVSEEGGSLTITNEEFLKNLSKTTNIGYEILVERFRDYRYNKANIDIFFRNDDLIFKLIFVGEKGKSNFTINIYDFKDTILFLLKLIGGGR